MSAWGWFGLGALCVVVGLFMWALARVAGQTEAREHALLRTTARAHILAARKELTGYPFYEPERVTQHLDAALADLDAYPQTVVTAEEVDDG